MKGWYLFLATLGVAAYASTPRPLQKIKNCIDSCKCKQNNLSNKLQVVSCDGPLILNSTSFRFLDKNLTPVISLENVIIQQIQENAFKNLGDLLIVNSKIGSIDDRSFNTVSRVKFSNCGFEDRPDLVSNRMTELTFGDCNLDEIPKLNGLLSLTYLNLSGNYIKDVEVSAFAQLFDLKDLYLSNNEIFRLPYNVFLNNDLNSLYLDHNPLKSFHLNGTKYLETLSLENCKLEVFDETSTKNLESVNELNLSNNKIKAISSKALSYIKDLSILNLSNNKLEKLNEHIFSGNPEILKVFLDGNNFQTLPNFYLKNGGVFSTYLFSCKHCGLNTLSSNVFKNMPGIFKLDLSYNEFMNVDNMFENIPSLKILDISYNNIAYISPQTFAKNKNMETVNLSGNTMMVLNPEIFANNPVIRHIDARNTSLQKLWDNHNTALPSLKKLLIGQNLLTTLTREDLSLMPHLQLINLNDNPFVFTDKFCELINWLEQTKISPIEYNEADLTSRMFENDINGYNLIAWKTFHDNKCPTFTTLASPVDIPIQKKGDKEKESDEVFDFEFDNENDSDKSTLYDDSEADDESFYNYGNEMEKDEKDLKKFVQVENSSLARASYILSFTSVFVLTALIVLTFAVTITLCILKRHNSFNNLPRVKLPLWTTTPALKKHSGSVYRPLSEDLSGPKTPKFSRYEFSSAPTVHSNNP